MEECSHSLQNGEIDLLPQGCGGVNVDWRITDTLISWIKNLRERCVCVWVCVCLSSCTQQSIFFSSHESVFVARRGSPCGLSKRMLVVTLLSHLLEKHLSNGDRLVKKFNEEKSVWLLVT